MKPLVLFVDDEKNLLAGLRRLTRGTAERWESAFATSGEEALGIMEKRPVSLVVTDMRMPGMDGARLLELISEKTPDRFCFALSGATESAQAIKIVGRSHRFLAKPIVPETLIGAIDSLFSEDGTFLGRQCRHDIAVFDLLKSTPGRLESLGALLARPEKSDVAIAAQIMSDPSLAVRMLQVCNSAYFGRPLTTVNIARAIGYLGLPRIAQLFENKRLGGEYAPDSEGSHDNGLRARAAVGARERAVEAGLDETGQELAFATALFSGLGGVECENGGEKADDCRSRAVCIAALFGLPAPLVASLDRFSQDAESCRDAGEIAAAAVNAAAKAIQKTSEAA
jgi:CheY-like chemotaxis protein